MKSLMIFATEIRQMYEVEKKSIRIIAKALNTYPIAIYRVLRELGIEVRDKSEAAKEALSSGRAIHPTKGKNLDEETRGKIGKSVAKNWKEMSKDKRENIVQKHKDNWENKSDEEKEELYKKSHIAIAESARLGSQMERFLHKALNSKGYDCYSHLKILENDNLEVDLAIPNMKIAIELDGPGHFSPIWGDEIFKKTQAADKQKNGLLILNGYKVIRITYTKGHVSGVLKEETLNKLVEGIENIGDKEILYITI